MLRRNRTKRQRYREFFAEGVTTINSAISHDWKFQSIWFCRERPLSDWAQGVLQKANATTHYEVTSSMLEKLSEKEDQSELLAILQMPADDPERLKLDGDFVVIVADTPANPGNLGTLIRSADAFGAAGVIVTGHAADVYDPRTIRASVGSLFSLPVIRLPGPAQVTSWLEMVRKSGHAPQVAALDPDGGQTLKDAGLSGPLVLIAGNEKRGVSSGYEAMSSVALRIPMQGAANSLNVAVAVSIALYEIRCQRAGR
ncbi:MAG: RNA methyltransferase [Candidatus Dormibacteraceae bacterium]